jgi:hypothetical protein
LKELANVKNPPGLSKTNRENPFVPVAILMGVKKPEEWDNHKKMIADPTNFL